MKLEVNNVSKSFKNIKILNNISVTFETGKIYGIVGRNGSGKSVFFKTLCGLYKPDEGRILCDDINIVEKNMFLPNTRVLINKPGFLPDVTGLENLKMLASIDNKIDENEIIKFFDLVNLKDGMNKKYGTYSLGMRQKLGIIQVIMEDPNIMIFDEPFNSIDDESSEKIRKYLNDIKEDKLILIATHMKVDIENLADKVYEMKEGNLIIK